MLAHRLRHRIEFQVLTDGARNPVTGDFSTEWVTAQLGSKLLSSVPAEVLTGPGREFIESSAKQAETTARISLRWFPGLLETWRVLWDGKIYNITSIETDATARRDYYLRCEAGVNDGR